MTALNITSIQSNLYWENKADNLRMFSQKIELLPAHAEVVILPEMFATGFTMHPQPFAETMEGDTVKWMQQTAAENKIILTGSVIIKEGDLFYNRLIWMLPNGELGFYDKRHLFAFAGENEKYRAGHKRLIASVKGW